MAVVAVPIAAAGVGAVYFVALTKTYSSAANFTAKRAFGIEDAYPWPFWKPWFYSDVESNSTALGTAGAIILAGVAFGVQRRFIWRHLRNSLRTGEVEEAAKIRSTAQFVRTVGPGIAEATANAVGTCFIAGAARPLIDGNNLARS